MVFYEKRKNFLGRFASAVLQLGVIVCFMSGLRLSAATTGAGGHDGADHARAIVTAGGTYGEGGIHASVPGSQCPMKWIQKEHKTTGTNEEQYLMIGCAIPTSGMPFRATSDAVGFATATLAFTDVDGATVTATDIYTEVSAGSALTSPAIDLNTSDFNIFINSSGSDASTAGLSLATAASAALTDAQKNFWGRDISSLTFSSGDLQPCVEFKGNDALSAAVTPAAGNGGGLINKNRKFLVKSDLTDVLSVTNHADYTAAANGGTTLLHPAYVAYDIATVTDREGNSDENTKQIKQAVFTYSFAYEQAVMRGNGKACSSSTNIIRNE